MARQYIKRWALPSPVHVIGASIYAIINADNNKIYIGSSVRTAHRWTEHRCELEDSVHANPYFQRAFNLNPTAFQLEVLEWIDSPTKEKLLAREQFWMDFFQSYKSENGYNAAPQASSCLGIKHPPEYGERMSKASKGQKWSEERKLAYRQAISKLPPHKGRGWTPEQIEAARRASTGRKPSEESKRKQSIAMTGWRFPERGRKVLQYSSDGVYLKSFLSIADASRELGIPECNIRQAMDSDMRRARKFLFRDYSENFPRTIPVKDLYASKKIPVRMIGSTGETIRIFNSMTEAASYVGMNKTSISLCCKNHNFTSGGFKWRICQ